MQLALCMALCIAAHTVIQCGTLGDDLIHAFGLPDEQITVCKIQLSAVCHSSSKQLSVLFCLFIPYDLRTTTVHGCKIMGHGDGGIVEIVVQLLTLLQIIPIIPIIHCLIKQIRSQPSGCEPCASAELGQRSGIGAEYSCHLQQDLRRILGVKLSPNQIFVVIALMPLQQFELRAVKPQHFQQIIAFPVDIGICTEPALCTPVACIIGTQQMPVA